MFVVLCNYINDFEGNIMNKYYKINVFKMKLNWLTDLKKKNKLVPNSSINHLPK